MSTIYTHTRTNRPSKLSKNKGKAEHLTSTYFQSLAQLTYTPKVQLTIVSKGRETHSSPIILYARTLAYIYIGSSSCLKAAQRFEIALCARKEPRGKARSAERRKKNEAVVLGGRRRYGACSAREKVISGGERERVAEVEERFSRGLFLRERICLPW